MCARVRTRAMRALCVPVLRADSPASRSTALEQYVALNPCASGQGRRLYLRHPHVRIRPDRLMQQGDVRTYVRMHVCMQVCMYVHVCVCMYVSMLVQGRVGRDTAARRRKPPHSLRGTHTHTHTHTHTSCTRTRHAHIGEGLRLYRSDHPHRTADVCTLGGADGGADDPTRLQ